MRYKMEKLVVIDGNFWLFSCYYATAAMGNLMVNKDGVPTNAVYGFANRLESLLKQNPEYIVVAFDAKGKTFRSELLEEYKGTRKPTPDELVCQFSMIREYLEAHHIPYCSSALCFPDNMLSPPHQAALPAPSYAPNRT